VTVAAYVTALEAIDPGIVHGELEKVIELGTAPLSTAVRAPAGCPAVGPERWSSGWWVPGLLSSGPGIGSESSSRVAEGRVEATADYEVWHGDTLVGTLWDVSLDQPWFLGRFVPGAGWDELAPLFAAQEEARRQRFRDHLAGAVAVVQDLGVELQSPSTGERTRPWMIYLSEGPASFRR
jgi:hypothetical protein